MIRHGFFLMMLLWMALNAGAQGSIGLAHLRCEMQVQPEGIDVETPRFSWELISTERNLRQVAYQVLVASSPELLARDEGDLWNSGKVASQASVHVPYAGTALQSGQSCYWKVKTWTNKGESSWSNASYYSMGLLKSNDWKAKWIGMDSAFAWDSVTKFSRLSARYIRKEIQVKQKIRAARIYIAGLGLYELSLNGKKIGDQVLAPAPTDYSKTVLYHSFDVTAHLQQGGNAVGVVLGNGRFFAMRQNYKPQKWHTFGFPKLLLQLEITYANGRKEIIGTDDTWKLTTDGPIRTNNEYDGEEYDATKELTGWNRTGYKDHRWLKAQLVVPPGGKLQSQLHGHMKVMEKIRPLSIRQLSPGVYILDMGQNIAGWVRMEVKGKKGQKVRLRYAESLKADGSLYMDNLRDAQVTDIYTLKGSGKESWAPVFVYHGFRFVEISGYPGQPGIHDFTGEVVYDDLATIGTLETSDATINQVLKNAYWGIRSNYKGMPVDCPQRNERQPWLGDRTTGAYGESFLFDNGNLYAKWLQDIHDAQTPEGSIPDVAPSFWYYYKDNMTWPGAYLTIADMLHRQFGNVQPIIRHYASMKKWMHYMKGKYVTTEHIVIKDNYGDWCVPPESLELIHSRDSTRTTDPKLIATAYYYYFLGLMERFALLSGHPEDTAGYRKEAVLVKAAFNKKFYLPAQHYYSNNTVTANILPLAFGLVPGEDSAKVFTNIVENILVRNKGHISTGVVGTQWLMRWLTQYGRGDIAVRLASNTTYPSWGYMAKNGATTIWELWNGNTANPEMNSQNHVMLLGDLLIWMFEHLAGIQSDREAAGYRKIIMKPAFEAGLKEVKAAYQSPFGKISSHWKGSGGQLLWNIIVPANSSAILHIPATDPKDITESGNSMNTMEGVKFLGMEKGCAVFEVGSGSYTFQVAREV